MLQAGGAASVFPCFSMAPVRPSATISPHSSLARVSTFGGKIHPPNIAVIWVAALPSCRRASERSLRERVRKKCWHDITLTDSRRTRLLPRRRHRPAARAVNVASEISLGFFFFSFIHSTSALPCFLNSLPQSKRLVIINHYVLK